MQTATATATGLAIHAFGDDDGIDDLILDVDNQGWIEASAEAFGDDDAEATAIGIDVHVFNPQNFDPSIEGLINNANFIHADADASGDDADAHAIGIHLDGPDIDAEILNTGFILAQAQAYSEEDNAEAEAEGILVTNDNADDSDEGVVEITNDTGAIVAEQYAGLARPTGEDDYVPFTRGTAIDTEDGPGEAIIELMGNNPDGAGTDVGNSRISDFLQTVSSRARHSATSTVTSRSVMRTRSLSPTARRCSMASSIPRMRAKRASRAS